MSLRRRQRKSDQRTEPTIPTFTVPCPICAEVVTVVLELKATYALTNGNGFQGCHVAIEPHCFHECRTAEAA